MTATQKFPKRTVSFDLTTSAPRSQEPGRQEETERRQQGPGQDILPGGAQSLPGAENG